MDKKEELYKYPVNETRNIDYSKITADLEFQVEGETW